MSAKGLGLSYQWRKDGVNISGATSASYTATAAGIYSVVVTNMAGSVTSSNAVVMTPPVITVQPSSGVLLNDSASLSVSATGLGLSYQWRKDGVNISGATSASYIATAAGIYSVVVTNMAGSVTSSGAVISAPFVVPAMVLVKGGTLPQGSALAGKVVGDFSIGNAEVTWGEFQTVRTWAASNGYDIGAVGAGTGSNHPVHSVSWYQAVKWCNARSEKEGKTPVYLVSGAVYRTGDSVPVVDANANGYRLPLEKEWEWAARGGLQSQGFTYSGGNSIDTVAWYGLGFPGYGADLGGATKVVGTKAANELGIYDMSGNVWEWCWDAFYGAFRRNRGGSWFDIASNCTVVEWNYNTPADGDLTGGFRVVLSSVP